MKKLTKTTIKYFFQQKILEVIGIPIAILAIWKVPIWLSEAIIKIFNIDAANTLPFCETDIIGTNANTAYCIGKVSVGQEWLCGLIILISLVVIIWFNWYYANKRAKKKIRIKEDEDDE